MIQITFWGVIIALAILVASLVGIPQLLRHEHLVARHEGVAAPDRC